MLLRVAITRGSILTEALEGPFELALGRKPSEESDNQAELGSVLAPVKAGVRALGCHRLGVRMCESIPVF